MESDQRSSILLFLILAIRHFGTSVVKCFDTSTPGIWDSEMELFFGLRSSLLVFLFWDFGVSHFSGSTFQHSCDEVLRHFNSRYLGPWNGVICQSTKLFIGVPISGFEFSRFRISQLGLLMTKSLDSSNSRYPKLSSCLRDFLTPLHLAL
jgi:hypothetical protein